MAKVVVSLESIDEARERRLSCDSSYDRWVSERAINGLMQPGIAKGRKLGKRPISRQGTLNQQMISRCPGSRHKGYDFVKAVYADRTGQE